MTLMVIMMMWCFSAGVLQQPDWQTLTRLAGTNFPTVSSSLSIALSGSFWIGDVFINFDYGLICKMHSKYLLHICVTFRLCELPMSSEIVCWTSCKFTLVVFVSLFSRLGSKSVSSNCMCIILLQSGFEISPQNAWCINIAKSTMDPRDWVPWIIQHI